MEPNKKNNEYQVLIIPVVVANGILSGIISVITSYFFKPLWLKIMTWWNKSN